MILQKDQLLQAAAKKKPQSAEQQLQDLSMQLAQKRNAAAPQMGAAGGNSLQSPALTAAGTFPSPAVPTPTPNPVKPAAPAVQAAGANLAMPPAPAGAGINQASAGSSKSPDVYKKVMDTYGNNSKSAPNVTMMAASSPPKDDKGASAPLVAEKEPEAIKKAYDSYSTDKPVQQAKVLTPDEQELADEQAKAEKMAADSAKLNFSTGNRTTTSQTQAQKDQEQEDMQAKIDEQTTAESQGSHNTRRNTVHQSDLHFANDPNQEHRIVDDLSPPVGAGDDDGTSAGGGSEFKGGLLGPPDEETINNLGDPDGVPLLDPGDPLDPGANIELPDGNGGNSNSSGKDLKDLYNRALEQLLSGDVPGSQEEKDALKRQLDEQNAQNIQSVRGRTGLGGMGLTGASAALEGSERRRGADNEVTQLAGLDRSNRAEQLSRLQAGMSGDVAQQQADIAQQQVEIAKQDAIDRAKVLGISLKSLEIQDETDYDGDNLINGLPVDDFKQKNKNDAAKTANEKDMKARRQSPISNLGAFPGDQQIGGVINVDGVHYKVYKNSDGDYYRVKA